MSDVDIGLVDKFITCCICKEEQSWAEPEEYTATNLMPDGAYTNDFPGAWVCLECIYCDVCHGDILENECTCPVKELEL